MSQRKDFLIFGSPRIEEEEIEAVVQVLRSGWLGTGPKVTRFETDFARYRGAEHATAVNSCTAALHLALLSSGIGPGDEVITTPMTFCATANAIVHTGAVPILADIDPQTLNLSVEEVRRKISPRTRAIVPVHFAGRPCEMDELMRLALEHDLKIIEDCAHAIETSYKGRSAGTFGDFGCFSFYVTKNVVTGEGGMVLSRSAADAGRVKILALHGMSKDAWKRFSDEGYKHYYVEEAGFKYNMTDIQAAIGIEQLMKVEAYWKRREEIWHRYMSELADLPITLPACPAENTRHGHHLFTLLIDRERCGLSRDEFIDAMTRANIGVGVHYLALTEHPYYARTLGWNEDSAPVATRVGRQIVSIPLSAKLTDSDVGDVISAVRQIVGSRSTGAPASSAVNPSTADGSHLSRKQPA